MNREKPVIVCGLLLNGRVLVRGVWNLFAFPRAIIDQKGLQQSFNFAVLYILKDLASIEGVISEVMPAILPGSPCIEFSFPISRLLLRPATLEVIESGLLAIPRARYYCVRREISLANQVVCPYKIAVVLGVEESRRFVSRSRVRYRCKRILEFELGKLQGYNGDDGGGGAVRSRGSKPYAPA